LQIEVSEECFKRLQCFQALILSEADIFVRYSEIIEGLLEGAIYSISEGASDRREP
jgi:hypothetical protein